MTTPSPSDFDALVAFLALFEDPSFVADRASQSTVDHEETPWPDYDPSVSAFMRLAAGQPWQPATFDVIETADFLDRPDRVAIASIEQLRQCLRYFVRGERFSTGHWGSVIEQGHVVRVLRRLNEVRPA